MSKRFLFGALAAFELVLAVTVSWAFLAAVVLFVWLWAISGEQA